MCALGRTKQASPSSWSPGMTHWTGPLPSCRGGDHPSHRHERADAAAQGIAAARGNRSPRT
eukprot:12780253-Alexandrium_andersonii.AAC.1